MRRKGLRFLVLACVLVALNVAGLFWIRHSLAARGRPKLRVLSALPTDNVDAADRFVLVFDEPVAPAGAVGQPAVQSPFEIAPAPAGRWQWASAERLEYVLDEPLPTGREYVIRPAPGAEARTGRAIVGEREFRFRTRPLSLVDCRLASSDSDSVTLELAFNQPVDPRALLEHLSIEPADAPPGGPAQGATCLVREPSNLLVVRAPRPGGDALRVRIGGDLAGHGGQIPLGREVVRQIPLEARFRLLRAETYAPGLEDKPAVRLVFSHTLDRGQELPEVGVSPAVEGLEVSRVYNALVLRGAFESGVEYRAVVARTLVAEDGRTLGDEREATFILPDRRPCVRLPLRRGILAPDGNLVIDLEAVNVSGLEVEASRVYANNLVAHLHGGARQDTARQTKRASLPLDLVRNRPQTLAFDLRRVMDRPRGIYRVTLRAEQPRWESDEAIVTVTDLALTAKRHRDGYLVWVTSLRTGRPVEGATVTALTRANQSVAAVRTDPEGIALLEVASNHPDGPAWVITAELGDDLSFLLPEERPWVLDEVDTSGRPAPVTYDVMLYPERGVYRPGDVVHLAGIVRDAEGRTPPAFPLSVRVLRPDGRCVAELPATPEVGQGFFHAEFATPADGQTGPYRFTVTLPGDEDALGAASVLVEPYAPVRIEVKAHATAERFGPGQTPTVEVAARYLFDQPAAGLVATLGGTLRRVPYVSAAFPGYTFGDPSAKDERPIEDVATALDEAGRGTLAFAAPAEPGCWRASVAATVTETGGRSVSANLAVPIDTRDRHLGLRLPDSGVLPTGTPVRVEYVEVTGADAVIGGGELEIVLERIEWDWSVEQVDGRNVWRSVERAIPAHAETLHVDRGEPVQGAFEVRCPEGGSYRLRVRDRLTDASAVASFYASHWSDASEGNLVNRPERLEVVLDRERYEPGAAARVVVRSPFAGTLLLAVETDRVVEQYVAEMDGRTFEFDLPVHASLRGGAFVTATVVRGVDPREDQWLPHRAIGMARMRVDFSSQALPVAIDAPAKIEPGRAVRARVSLGAPGDPARPGVVHVWAVDEGILLTTGQRTPDPMEHFFAPRRLEVASADVFADLLPDHRRPETMLRIGADGSDEEAQAEAAALRRGPDPVNVRQAVVWRSAVPVGPDGTVDVEFDVPRFTGELRLMAVAADGDRYGSAHRAVTVTAPLLVEAAWPRFVAPGDAFEVPVKLFNTTDAPLTASVQVAADGPVRLVAGRRATAQQADAAPREGDGPATLSLPPAEVPAGGSTVVWLTGRADGLGTVHARVVAAGGQGGAERVAEDEREMLVRPVTALDSVTRLFALRAGESLRVEPAGGFVPGAGHTLVAVSGRPNVQLRPVLQALLDYPYGCVEQTTSTLYAVLYAPDLLEGATAEEARRMVEAGITRLWSMQTRSGGLAYWPGGRDACLWGTAYAAGFLAQAKRAGYTIDPRFTRGVLDYLDGRLNDPDESMSSNQRAAVCHVLAAFGREQSGWLRRLAERPDELDMAGRAHLAAAWLELGRRDLAEAALPEDTLAVAVPARADGAVRTPLSQQAALLEALLDLDAQHSWAAVLARRLEEARQVCGAWGSTYENALCLAALARYQLAGEQGQAAFRGTMSAAGERLDFDSATPRVLRVGRADAALEVASEGEGTIYLAVTAEGLSAGDVPAYDRRMQVSRAWTDRAGRPIDLEALRVGDLVNVAVTCRTLDGQVVENVAIVDALPGGLEAENPRLSTSAAGGSGAAPDRLEFRDDRVVVFATIGPEPVTFRYALRAVGNGVFALPPVQASCMYDASYASIHGGGRVVIGAPTAEPAEPALHAAAEGASADEDH